MGNRLTRVLGSTTETYAYATAANQVATITTSSNTRSFSYLASGQVSQDVRDSSDTYTFAANDNGRNASAALNGTTAGAYLYNAFEQRVEKTVGSAVTQFVFDRFGHLLEEANGSGAAQKEYIWLDDVPVALVNDTAAAPVLYFIHTDQLGTPHVAGIAPSQPALTPRVQNSPSLPRQRESRASIQSFALDSRVRGNDNQPASRVLNIPFEGDPDMTALTLAHASTIVDKALEKGRELKLHPLTVVVLDAGGHLVAMKREDKSGILRTEIATGKAWGTLGMGFGGREFARRTAAGGVFLQALMAASGGRVVPAPGGVLIRDAAGEIIGAVGISGDTSEKDETCAVYGISCAGLAPDTGDPG